jgi:hypothetical protein
MKGESAWTGATARSGAPLLAEASKARRTKRSPPTLPLFPPRQAAPARSVAVRARPAAWCPGLDAPEHLNGT